MTYDKGKLKLLTCPFVGVENIEKNYSQTAQDLFVLTMLNGKRDGVFLEIGAQDPIEINNTYLLETQFGWSGLSIDLDPSVAPKHKEHRKRNFFMNANALEIDYEKVLAQNIFPPQVDYLQIDIDPAIQSLNVLKLLPLDKYRFSVITFEHDAYRAGEGQQVKEESRRIFASHGYVMMAGNISNEGSHDPFEDWWVDPKVVDSEIVKRLQREGDINLNGGQFLGIFDPMGSFYGYKA